jgi:4-amino-4-deoxy-L-arabinose transferase-like glycosyltransferase
LRIEGDRERMAWAPVLGIAGTVSALLLLVARRYGWHRDELYFLEAGRHLAWGYIDQPPFTPAIARLADRIAPDNLVALRLLPALASAVTIAVGALIVRELGGRRSAQITGAAVVASGGFLLGVGHLLSTAAFDLMAWMALLGITARVLRRSDPRWWIAFGGVAGVSMLNKNLLVLLAAALLTGLVIERRWDLLLTPWLAVGAALALVIAAPNLLWQADHGWPQADMARALSERLAGENRATLVPLQLLFVGPAYVVVLWRGARWLAADVVARPFRPLLWAWPVGLVAAFATGGRPYYVLPLTTVVVLAGVAASKRPTLRGNFGWLVAPNAIISVFFALPVLPLSATSLTAELNEAVAETVGWPELADQVARVVDGLPPEERATVILLTGSYGEAGALDRFGPARGLPPAYSPHNSYADFRRPTDEDATVVAVRFDLPRLAPYFDRCDQVATVDNGLDVSNEVQGTPIVLCRGLRGTWPDAWDELRFLS